MLKRLFVGIAALLIMATTALSVQQERLVVYYNPNCNFRPMSNGYIWGGLPPWEIDWTGVTHVVISLNLDNVTNVAPYFTQLSGADSIEYEFGAISNPGSGPPFTHYLDSTVNILHRNGIKAMMCVAQLSESSTGFAEILADTNKSKALAKTLVLYMVRKNLDGAEYDVEYAKPTSPDIVQHAKYVRQYMNTYMPNGLISFALSTFDEMYIPPSEASAVDWFSLMSYGESFWCGVHRVNEFLNTPPLYVGYAHDYTNAYSVLQSRTADNEGGADAWVRAGHPKNKIVLGQMMETHCFVGIDTLLGPVPNNGGWGNWVDAEQALTRGGVEIWDNTRKASHIAGVATAPFSGLGMSVSTGQKFLIQRLSLKGADTIASVIRRDGWGGLLLYDIVHGRAPNSATIPDKKQRIPIMSRVGAFFSNGYVPPIDTTHTDTTVVPVTCNLDSAYRAGLAARPLVHDTIRTTVHDTLYVGSGNSTLDSVWNAIKRIRDVDIVAQRVASQHDWEALDRILYIMFGNGVQRVTGITDANIASFLAGKHVVAFYKPSASGTWTVIYNQ